MLWHCQVVFLWVDLLKKNRIETFDYSGRILLSQKLPYKEPSKPRVNQGQVMSTLMVNNINGQPLPYFCQFNLPFSPPTELAWVNG